MSESSGGQGAKQQIVERLKQSTNVLITVSKSPSVDELCAALGMAILLNKLDKHATAVVSGDIPPAITFLDPEKTFENTVNSLRDFIIALDKEKADHLRYKVDGDVVKIFITPYKTTISQDDLDFSQGDYNVEVVLALGVKSKDELDVALEAHGRILHDATVASLSCGEEASDLGSVNWFESSASSISEMLVSLSEALKAEDKPVIDEQSATAFLTGIVAATNRFSNNKTTSKVMTMAAQLMAAGANQQLIAAKLEDANAISVSQDSASDTISKKTTKKSATKNDDGSLSITHDEPPVAPAPTENLAEEELATALDAVAPVAPLSTESVQQQLAEVKPLGLDGAMPDYEPTLGGVLNATTQEAADEKREEANSNQNRTILTHNGSMMDASDGSPSFADTPLNAAMQDTVETQPGLPPLPGVTESVGRTIADPSAAPSPTPAPLSQPTQPIHVETLAEIDEKNRKISQEDALSAVHAAIDDAPFNPAGNPTMSVGAQPLGNQPLHADNDAPDLAGLPPLPDFTTLPPVPVASGARSPEELNQLLGVPPPTLQQLVPAAPSVLPGTPPAAADPNQFKIPTQN